MHFALTYLWTCLFFGGGGGQMGFGGVVVAWHKAELINFSNQFDFFTNLFHLSLNISNIIIILFWGSGIGRWVWPDTRTEVILSIFKSVLFLNLLNQNCMEMNLERKANQRLSNRVDSFATHAYNCQFHWTNVLAICVCYSKPTLKLIHHIIG